MNSNCHFLLYRHRFTLFIFSIAITVKRRTASLSLSNVNFYVTIFPCCYVVSNWRETREILRNLTERIRAFPIDLFFSHTFQTRQIFLFFSPLFDSFCDKLSCDVRSFFVFDSSIFSHGFFFSHTITFLKWNSCWFLDDDFANISIKYLLCRCFFAIEILFQWSNYLFDYRDGFFWL